MTTHVEELVYRSIGNRQLKALIFRPDGSAAKQLKSPAIVCLHGGAWITGDRRVPAYMAEKLAERGFVVMSIDFRMAPRHQYPSSLLDINYAIRWLRQNADNFDVNPDAIGGLGFSSGGHLILLSAMRPEWDAYTADLSEELRHVSAELDWVVTCSGVLDPLARYRMAQQAGYADIIACHDKYFGNEENMREGNPPLILERKETVSLPPLLMFQGGDDPRLPPDMATRVAELYLEAGGEAEALVYPGQGHALSEWPEALQEEIADRIQVFAAQV